MWIYNEYVLCTVCRLIFVVVVVWILFYKKRKRACTCVRTHSLFLVVCWGFRLGLALLLSFFLLRFGPHWFVRWYWRCSYVRLLLADWVWRRPFSIGFSLLIFWLLYEKSLGLWWQGLPEIPLILFGCWCWWCSDKKQCVDQDHWDDWNAALF